MYVLWILRFTSDGTPADLLVANIAAYLDMCVQAFVGVEPSIKRATAQSC